MSALGAQPVDFALAAARGLVRGVTFRSQVTPEFTYNPWAPGPPPAEGQSLIMDLAKPTLVIDTTAGPVVIAPAGEATRNYFPLVAAGTIAALVGAVVLVGWIARRL